MKKQQPDMIPAQHFLLSMQNGIVDETLTVRAIRSEPYCEFSKPVASALNSFSNPHSYCVLSDPIHSVTEPAPLEDNRNISFFTGNLCYSETTTPSTICWAFMTIHNSSQSHYHIIYLVTSHSLQKVSLSLWKQTFHISTKPVTCVLLFW